MRLVLTSFLAVWGAFFASAADPGWIPCRILGRVVMVEALVNGRGPFLLIVDTGATETVLTPAVARRAGLRVWNSGSEQYRATAAEVAVSGAAVRDFGVFVFDPPQALSLRLDKGVDYGGMLGYSFLSRFVTTIDYPGRRLRFDAIGKRAASKGVQGAATDAHSIPFTLKDRLICLQGRINGRGPLTWLLDTGSAEVMVLPDVAARLGLTRSRDGGGGGRDVGFSVLEEMDVGGVRASNVNAVVARLGWENPAAVTYDGIAGYPFLSNRVITVNYRDKTVSLGRGRPVD